MSQLTQVLQIYPDKNIQKGVNKGFSQEINQTIINNGVKLTIDSVVADDRKAIIMYTMSTENKNLTNLFIKNLKITDKDNNLIVTSEKSFGFDEERASNTSTGKDIFHIIDAANCISNINLNMWSSEISTTDALNKDFLQTHETKGLIEIENANQDISVPDVLNLDFSKLDEAYPQPGENWNEDNTDYNYNKFTAKYNRAPISINGNWKFSIILDKKLKSASVTQLNNIKFSALNIDFNLEYVKIYPTTAEVKMTYNSKDSELVARGIFPYNSYIEDDISKHKHSHHI